MFDVIRENIIVIVVLLIIMWILQFGFTYLQMKKFYARLKLIRQKGLTAVGMAGGKYKGRTYGVLTVDKNKQVIHAEKMSGWTNFAGLKPVTALEGLTLDQIRDEIRDEENQLPISAKLQIAFRNAAKDLLEADLDKIADEQTTDSNEE